MSRLPLGETLLKLGLITSSELQSALTRAADDSQQKLGEITIKLGLIDEEGLAKALAYQHDLGFVSADRLLGLEPSAESLAILTHELMLGGPVLPTFKDPETGAISLLIADPNNEELLDTIRKQTNAPSLKLYVVPRTPLQDLLERALEHVQSSPAPVSETMPEVGPRVRENDERLPIVLDANAQRLSTLKQLDLAEGADALYATSPEQVTEHLSTGRANRLLYRSEDRAWIDEHLEEWQQLHPWLHVAELGGFGPASHSGVDYQYATDFLLNALEFTLVAAETENLGVRLRTRRTSKLARAMADELGLSRHEKDTVFLAAILLELQEMSLLKGLLADTTHNRASAGRFEAAKAFLAPFQCPFPVLDLLEILETRLVENQEVSDHLGAEILYTVRAVLRTNPNAVNLVEVLGPELDRHAANVVDALSQIHDLEPPADQISTAAVGTVIIAERDTAVLTALELRLGQAGLDCVIVPDGEAALIQARKLRPAALIAGFRMPRKDGLSLVMDIRQDPILRNTPVILITGKSSAIDVNRGRELGANAVLEKPINIKVLMDLLETAIQKPAPQGEA